jgi:hypothetical protein
VIFTGVVNQAAPLVYVVEAAEVNCSRLLATTALPVSDKPLAELNPLGKLMAVPVVWMVYVAIAVALGCMPGATAMALIVSEATTAIAVVYTADDVVGVVPLVV